MVSNLVSYRIIFIRIISKSESKTCSYRWNEKSHENLTFTIEANMKSSFHVNAKSSVVNWK